MDVYQKQQFFNPSIGGKPLLNIEDTHKQLNVLNAQVLQDKRSIPNKQNTTIKKTTDIFGNSSEKRIFDDRTNDTNQKTLFDPIADWEHRVGLDHKSRSRQTVHYLHIDSINRQKIPIMTVSEYYTLDKNPLTTTLLNNELFITQIEHPFKVEDKITIDGIAPVNNKLFFNPSTPIITFHSIDYESTRKNFSYIQVEYPHGIPIEYSSDSYLTNLYCEIQNFTNKQTSGDVRAEQYYGNVPLPFVNKVHTFFLSKVISVSENIHLDYDANKFYIELPFPYTPTPGTPSTYTSYFNLLFYYVNGIPLNQINAKSPTDIYHSSYYHIIRRVTSTGYYITLNSTALGSGVFGGSNVQIGAIFDFRGGYIEPNAYKIELEKPLKNIIKVQLRSTEFPNSEYVIKDYPTESANNKLYWQNYDDGSHTYSVSIPPGKYTPSTLISVLQTTIYDEPRYFYPPVTQNYTNHNYILVSMDTDSDTTTFQSYRESILRRAFTNIYYINASGVFSLITTDATQDPAKEYIYPLFVLVHFQYHGMTLNTTYETTTTTYIPDGTTGDKVRFANTITYMGISATVLDGEYEVFAPNGGILSANPRDDFMIMLPTIDIHQYTTRVADLGGGIFNAYAPNKFRLLFDQPDTLGSMLGFPNVGDTTAVTKYSNIITNKESYQPDINPSITADITTPGNAIMLSGYNYIIMVCDQLPVIETIGKIKTAFAKINLVGIPGKMVFNTFVSTPKDYYEPIKELSELNFSFYTPSGDLYDFNGLDHSFTLEITTLDDLPQDTNINPHTGRIIN